MSLTRKRLLAMVPGLMLWTTLVVSVTLSFIRPLWMIYFVILFDLYWLLRILYFLPFLLTSWYLYRKAIKRDWQSEAEKLPGYSDIRHLIFLPTYKEDQSVVEETLKNLVECPFPTKRMMIVFINRRLHVILITIVMIIVMVVIVSMLMA